MSTMTHQVVIKIVTCVFLVSVKICSVNADEHKMIGGSINNLPDGLSTLSNWKPSWVFDNTDAIIIGESRAYHTTVVYMREGRLKGEGRIQLLQVHDILYNDVSGANEVLFLHPPAGMHEYAGLHTGKAIFFLRKLSVPEKEYINTLIPQEQKQIAKEQDLWTFATEEIQWMSYISISDEMRTCQLGRRLQRIAKIEKVDFEKYVKGLVTLRKQATRVEILPPTINLDEFQRDILERFIGQ